MFHSGNFGNLAGGLIAKKMGLPVKRFVISTNENDEVPVFLRTGDYKAIIPSRNCISSAMNVGHPSNLARIIALYSGRMDEKGEILKQPDLKKMRKELFATAFPTRRQEIRSGLFTGSTANFLSLMVQLHGLDAGIP